MISTDLKLLERQHGMLHKNILTTKRGPLIDTSIFDDTKDPCPVFDRKLWHIYGSGGSSKVERWNIFHATAPALEGPWKEEAPAVVPLDNPHVAAPGVIYDLQERCFHMFVQTDFLSLHGTVEHLTSTDGHTFSLIGTALYARPGSEEACIYDPHPAIINNGYYLTYSAAADVGRPDIYLARSINKSWYGPWERVGKILSHEQVPHHNQRTHPDYEWGLEGSQLIELRNGKILMNAVCFLPDDPRGTRQRIFFALADDINAPFKSIGPIMQPSLTGWDSGENGHAAAVVHKGLFYLFYQARPYTAAYNPWRYGIATCPVEALEAIETLVR